MGYKDASCPPNIPTKTQTGGGFEVWQFLTSIALTSTIAANIANNVNNNNNNNNDNNNLDNQNTNNYNNAMNTNSNNNVNAQMIALGRAISNSYGASTSTYNSTNKDNYINGIFQDCL